MKGITLMMSLCISHDAGFAGAYTVENALTDKVKGNRALSKEVKEVLQNKKKADLISGRVSMGPGYVLASDLCEFELKYLAYRARVTEPHVAVLTGALHAHSCCGCILVHFGRGV